MTDPDGSTINPDISLHTAALLLSAPTFCLRLYLHPTSDKSNSSLLISNHRATGRLILVTAPEENRDEVDRHTFRKTRMNLFFSSPGAVCSQPVQLLITALKCCLSTRGRSKYGYWCFTARPDVVCLWYQTLSNVLARHVRPALTLNILQPVGPAEMTRVLVTLCLWRCWKDARMKVFVTSWQVQS